MKQRQQLFKERNRTHIVQISVSMMDGEGRNGHDEIEKAELEEQQQAEEVFRRNPPWSKQITVRGLVASFVIGVIYSVIVMKLNLTTGLVPSLNVSAALLAFVFLRTWTKMLRKAGILSKPFTRQENTVVQTCAVACYSIAVGGGFGSYLLGLSKKTYEQAGDTEGNTPGSYKDPGVGWITSFLFVVSFVGLLALVPLRKIMIIDYKLTYPSGTATAVLINGFHTPQGDKMARFYFDFSLTYIGAGMICSHLVNLSLLLGAVISWGIMWPLIHGLKGDWYSDSLPESSMKGLQGYKVFISIALILGDGLYNFVKILVFTIRSIHAGLYHKSLKTVSNDMDGTLEDLHRDETFVKDKIPVWIACCGYVLFSVVSIIAIPLMFPEMRWYYVLIAYIFAPVLGFCNAYGAGLTDMNMAYNYGKVSLFILAAWAGKDSGVVAGLVGCGLIKSIVSISADLMQDFKSGHLTLTSPRSMLVSQAIGTAMGCVIAPLTFFLFYQAFDVGSSTGDFKAPYALIYRNMAILGVEGFSALPKHCLQLCFCFFAFAVMANLVRDVSPAKLGRWVPLPMAMAVPFLVGAYFAIDMCVGSLIVFIWHTFNNKKATLMVPAVASGLICGDGLWILPSSLLALAKMSRLSSNDVMNDDKDRATKHDRRTRLSDLVMRCKGLYRPIQAFGRKKTAYVRPSKSQDAATCNCLYADDCDFFMYAGHGLDLFSSSSERGKLSLQFMTVVALSLCKAD
ncbi:Metal-nicotianamine transporter ysl3 [Asimina triloba]